MREGKHCSVGSGRSVCTPSAVRVTVSHTTLDCCLCPTSSRTPLHCSSGLAGHSVHSPFTRASVLRCRSLPSSRSRSPCRKHQEFQPDRQKHNGEQRVGRRRHRPNHPWLILLVPRPRSSLQLCLRHCPTPQPCPQCQLPCPPVQRLQTYRIRFAARAHWQCRLTSALSWRPSWSATSTHCCTSSITQIGHTNSQTQTLSVARAAAE